MPVEDQVVGFRNATVYVTLEPVPTGKNSLVQIFWLKKI